MVPLTGSLLSSLSLTARSDEKASNKALFCDGNFGIEGDPLCLCMVMGQSQREK